MARKIAVEIVGDASSLQRAFKKSAASAGKFNQNIEKSGKGHKVLGGIKDHALGIAAGVAGFGTVTEGVKKAIGDASDLNEELGKTKVVFKDSSGEILDWSKTTSNALGISRHDALAAAGVFGNMLVPMGVARGKAADMSRTMVDLAGDMASFNNASPEDTLDALRSGLAGESEPLRRYGVDLRDAALQQYATSKGIKTAVKDMTSQQKQQLIYKKILNDTKDAQGDASRTGQNWAGVQRRLGALVEDLSGKLGTTLLPQLTNAANAVADWLGKTKNQKAIMDTLKGVIEGVGTVVGTLRGAFHLLSKAVGGNRRAFKLLIGLYAAWKVAGIVGKISTLAGSFRQARGATNKATGAAKNFRGSLAGKAGVAGAVVLAGWALSKLIRKIPGWDKKMKEFGATIYDVAANLGLIHDPMAKFKGTKIVSQGAMRTMRQEAARLERSGHTPRQTAAILRRRRPGLDPGTYETAAGVRGRRPTININHLVVNPRGYRQLEDDIIRHAKRLPHPRRG